MHFKRSRLLAAGLAALMSAFVFACPAAAVTDQAVLSDINNDGVIDVFDYLLGKRASVTAPLDLTISSAEGCPGDTITVCAAVSNNLGFSESSIAFDYSKELELCSVEIPNGSELTEASILAAQNVLVAPAEAGRISLASAQSAYTEENGMFALLTFRIPQNAAEGTVYSVSFIDTVLKDNSGNPLPMLTERGKITVLPSETSQPPELPVTTTTEPVVTTAPDTTVSTETTETTTVTTTTVTTTETKPVITTVSTTKEPPVTTTTTERIRNGIDISAWQGNVDFNKIKNESNTEFVVVRAGYGKYLTQEDRYFQTYYNGAKSVGLPVGAYWYSYAYTPEEARIEANVCAQVLGKRQFEYPIAFDIEEPGVLNLGIDAVSAIIEAFCSEMEKKGYFVQVYCSSFYLNHTVNDTVKSRYDVWVANYNVARPSFTGKYGMWQYGIGTCAGVNGDCDVDYGYRNYEAIIKSKHLNNY